jgi:hypothetical protein
MTPNDPAELISVGSSNALTFANKMTPKWHFNERRPSDRVRDTANDAFFTAESLENLSEALVREGIQNSLDAAERSDGSVRQVRVRIRFVPRASADARQYLTDLFSSARQNFEAGLSRSSLDRLFGEQCGYLYFAVSLLSQIPNELPSVSWQTAK